MTSSSEALLTPKANNKRIVALEMTKEFNIKEVPWHAKSQREYIMAIM